MPLTYRIDLASRTVFTNVRGVLDDEQPLAYLSQLFDDPDYETGMNALVDARGLERLELTPEGVKRLASHTATLEERFHGSRVALVANDDATYGTARMYQSRRADAPYQIEVFRDLASAQEWLAA